MDAQNLKDTLHYIHDTINYRKLWCERSEHITSTTLKKYMKDTHSALIEI